MAARWLCGGLYSAMMISSPTGISFLNLDSDLQQDYLVCKGNVRALGLSAKALPPRRKRPVRPRVDIRYPKCRFSDRILRQFCLGPSIVIEIYCALQATYPAGDGNIAILRSMPPNNRRVRCPSA